MGGTAVQIFTITEVKANFSRLLAKGEKFIVSVNGEPRVKFEPIAERAPVSPTQ
jgi:antitoxin (DNA-binding transcriptional repressor) of toxin-antitoxin stability system